MRLFLCLLAAVLGGPALGQMKQSDEEFCAGLSQTAAAIMKARQNGVTMAKMMQIAANDGGAIYKTLTVEAFEVQRFSTEENKMKAVLDFENKTYLDCYKVVTKPK